VGEHLADQLLLPLVLGAGGQFKTLSPSLHFLTNIQVIEQFLGPKITVNSSEKNTVIVSVTTS